MSPEGRPSWGSSKSSPEGDRSRVPRHHTGCPPAGPPLQRNQSGPPVLLQDPRGGLGPGEGSEEVRREAWGAPSTFADGQLSLHHKATRELQTFREFVPSNLRMGLAADPARFAGAAVLGELVLLHAGSDENPELFDALLGGMDLLQRVDEGHLLPALLREIWTLTGQLGYAPSVRECVGCGNFVGEEEMGRFDFAEGGIRCPRCHTSSHGPRLGPTARAQLAAVVEGNLPEELIRPRAHLRLASDFITYHVSGGSPLRSFEVLWKMIPKGHG